MARTAYTADQEIQDRLFGEGEDMDLYSAAQVTDIVAADFVRYAEADADFYLAFS
jgi:hypothetical protein